MRKIYLSLPFFLLLFFWATKSNAQINTYVFAQSSGTYTENTDPARVILGTTASDDQVFNNNTAGATAPVTSTGFPIGFNFTYNGAVYDKFAVNNNGWIVVATGTFQIGASSGSNYTPLSSLGPVGVVNAIAGLGRDIQGQAGSELSYQTLGTVPNRVLVVQWKGYRRFNGTGQNYNFQVRLNESSNSIQVVYGAFTESSATDAIPQVGLRGATNADFNNRTGAWASSAAGAVNTASMVLTNAAGATPVSGLTYTWLPPPPCVPGSLGGGTTTGPAGAICPGLSFTLTVTGASFGSGLTYLWESSPDGSSWTSTGVTTTTITTSTLVNRYYRRKMTCSGVDAYSTSLLVTVTAPLALPVTEGFNTSGTTVFPNCWSQQYVIGTGNITFQTNTGNPTTTPFEGTRYVYWNSFSIGNGNETRLVSPAIVTTGTTSVDVQFYWYNENSAAYTTLLEGVQVQYSLNGTTWTDAGAFIPRQDVSLAVGTGQWKLKKITLPAAAGNQASILVGFKFHSVFGDNCSLDAVNILATPACTEPSGLTVTTVTPTTASLSWTASPSNPSNGYQWEVRTSGAPGSGATGLAASGTTAAAVTTASVAGLNPNTAYSYYVRSDCGGSFSIWTAGFAFTTPCVAIAVPFTETFSTYATTFPPSCWTRNNTTYLIGDAATASGTAGSAKFNFFAAASGTNLDLVSPLFTAVPTGYRVTFDHAYATYLGEVDQLQVFYSTDGGVTYTNLATLLGGAAGPLNTAGSTTAVFTPNASQWQNKSYSLPVGTNRLRFRGVSAFGNNLYLDNITVEPTPSCLPVTAVSAVAISPTSVIVSFTPPATTPTIGYIVEYGSPGFIPGTTNTPGTGGTLVFGAGSPITVTGLTPNTPYDFYVRKICIAGVDFSTNKKITATTLCAATNIPYLQNFESSVLPAPPTCTSVEDVNGNSGSVPNSGGGSWFTYDGGANAQTFVSPTKTIRYLYDASNSTRPADDWFYTQGLNLTAGTNYRLKFFIKASDGPTWTERLEVKYGTLAHSSGMTNLLYTNNNIATALASSWDSVIVDFAPAASGVYYIGFHAISLADQAFLYLDNVSVKLAPLVDVGITGITVPSLNCPTSNVFVQATVTNYNTTPQNFATYPVTVTANITGAGTGTLTTLLNSGTLAPGASMSVYLSPAFNFSVGGIYNITVSTATTPASNDPETGNDSYSRSVTVNPNPEAPTITPASASVCAGNPVQLSTQFIPSPPPVPLPPVSSGTIAVAIPDATPAGTSHTLNVNTVPAGANVVGISVTVNVTHTWIGDVIINLKAPNGNVLNLINQRGGSGDNLSGTTFTSVAGAASLATGVAPFSSTFAPDANAANPPTAFPQNVTSFNGLMSVGNGAWTLALRDNAGLDIGTLTSWSITITYQILTPTITWTPATGLYTNAAATTAYTGGNAYSLYANPAATTTYTVTATTVAGCTASTLTTVTVNPYPVVGIGTIPDTVCISDPVIALPATPIGGTWTGVGVSGNTFIPPSTAVGTYTLTYTFTSSAGCTTTATKKIAVKDCPERMILLRDNALLLYPNPNTGRFNIKVNSVLYNNLVMKVYTNNGVLVRTQQLGGLAWGRVVPIDLTSLPGGVYMVKFYYDGGVRTAEKTFKVIIAMD